MAELSSAAQDFLQHVTSRVGSKSSRPSASARSERIDALLEEVFAQAAVLHVFALEDLMAADIEMADADAIRRELKDASFIAPGQRFGGHRSLRRAVRLTHLRNVGSAEAALELIAHATAKVATPTQAIFEDLLSATLPPVETLSQAQLFLLEEVQAWASALGVDPIDPERLDRVRTSAQAVSSFQHLLDEEFVGRDEEVQAVQEILGIADPGLLTRLGSLFRGGVPRLIYLEGVGGIGKTALIGHVLNSFRADEKGPRFGFAYLACDDPGFDILSPRVMLEAAATQIANHVRLADLYGDGTPDPGHAEAEERFRRALADARGTRTYATKRATTYASQEGRLADSRASDETVWHAFAALCEAASRALGRSRSNAPAVVLIVDSFEFVQGRAETVLRPFWDCLRVILRESAAVRVVVAGRSPLDRRELGVPIYHKEMEELGETAAVDLLQRETGGDTETLRRIHRHIGGNPLNLRLAARVLNDGKESVGTLQSVRTRSRWFLRLGPEIIRGRLYQRVLDHIDDSDPRVRTLVHPGMVLRRITPEIIHKVLAPVCNIEVKGLDDAKALFKALQAEHTLVHVDDDGSLRYRQDLRQPVLELLKADQPELTRNAHAAVAAWYAGQTDPISVAEHVYHRLMLDEEPDDFVWIDTGSGRSLDPATHAYLAPAMDEVPPRGKLFLAAELGLEIRDDLRAEADVAEWERIIGPRVLQTLQSAGTETALALLSEREERSEESPLLAIEARCYLSLEQYDRAEAFIREKLATLPVAGNPGRRAELMWLLAQTQLRPGRREEGIETLIGLAEATKALSNAVPRIQTLAVLADLLPQGDPRRGEMRDQLAEALGHCSEDLFSEEADVIRYGFSRLTIEKSGKLPGIALMTISTMYDVVAQGEGYQPTRDMLDGLRDHAQALDLLAGRLADGAAADADKPGYSEAMMLRDLAREMRQLLPEDQLSTGVLLKLVSAIRGALTQGAGPESQLSRAACMATWLVTQGIEGSLMAATLGGLRPYREPWELNTAIETLA